MRSTRRGFLISGGAECERIHLLKIFYVLSVECSFGFILLVFQLSEG